MSASSPLLSVVIPTRNRREMAAQALESALLALPFPHEVILSDNASTDTTPDLRSLFPGARYIRREKTIPMAEHWNLCVSEARGTYIKLLCDDDWLIPGALAREVAAMERNLELALCASARYENTPNQSPVLKNWGNGSEQLLSPKCAQWKMLIAENFIGPPSSVSFRKACFGGFPTQFSYAADWAAWLLLCDKGSLLLLPEPGAHFRQHAGNLTLHAVETGRDFVEVQALRGEALRRMTGLARIAGTACLAWIYIYRLGRRIARHALKGDISGLLTFLGRTIHQRPGPLPRS